MSKHAPLPHEIKQVSAALMYNERLRVRQWLTKGCVTLGRERWNSCCHCPTVPMKLPASKCARNILSLLLLPAPSKFSISRAGYVHFLNRFLFSIIYMH